MKTFLEGHNQSRLSAYRKCPQDLREHHGIEETVLAGGYGYRQILELVQNGADAILEDSKGADEPGGGRIEVLIHDGSLYVANTGAALSEEGLQCLLSSHSSPKRGNEIGRFGLGFKSLLRLGGKIDLMTRASGGIRFDPNRCRSELKQTFNVEHAPGLRLAWPLQDSQLSEDPILSRFSWAETIVRARVADPAFVEHLRKEIREFPPEFLLFLEAAIEIQLDNGSDWNRHYAVRPEGGEYVLTGGESPSRWIVTRCNVPVDDPAARTDATHIHARDSVPLAWAIPLDSQREEAGRFWAFFPTHTPTYLPGILNAPWKLNSDRNAVIPGEWNLFLMRSAASLVASTIPSLATTEDPGRVLDFFPRQMPRTDEDAAPLVEALLGKLAESVVVPDGNGTPKTAASLCRHPAYQADVIRGWEVIAQAEARGQFVHSSCLLKQRASRLNALAKQLPDNPEASNLATMAAEPWFEKIASSEPLVAIRVLKLVEIFCASISSSEWNRMRGSLPIVPVEDGGLVTPRQAVFAGPDMNLPGRRVVATALADDAEGRRILEEVLGVRPLDDSEWSKILIEHLPTVVPQNDGDATVWDKWWGILRSAPVAVRMAFLKEHAQKVRLRLRDGSWVYAGDALLPGALVAEDDPSSNRNLLVDAGFHGNDRPLLQCLDVRDMPEGIIQAKASSFEDWLDYCRMLYRQQHQRTGNRNHIRPRRDINMPKGWLLLPRLKGASQAKLTRVFLVAFESGQFGPIASFGNHASAAYPKITVCHPLPWFLLTHGAIMLGSSPVRISVIHARRADPALGEVPAYSNLLRAVAGQTPFIPVPTPDEIAKLWRALILERATAITLADDSLRELWSGAAKDGVVPETIPSIRGNLPLSEVFVTTVPDLARRVRHENRVVVTLDDKTAELWVSHGARALNIKPEWSQQRGEVARLAFIIPEIGVVLTPAARESAICRSVISLALRVEETSEPIPTLFWNGELLLDPEQLQHLSRSERFGALLHALDGTGWLDRPVEQAVSHLADSEVDKRRAAVASGLDLAERLLLAIGERKAALLEGLGELGTLGWVQEQEPLQLSQLALANFGPATLITYKRALEEEGLQPPSRWGTIEARAFVAAIGIPVEFAVAPAARREPEEIITGPIDLPPLHNFQEEVFAGISRLLDNGGPRRRAVISLPTGGGKTRVAVEAAVCLVLQPECARRTILWVAQTDELCEQAVQAFRQVWLNKGAQSTDLRIVRLWGRNPNPSPPADGKPVAVVASIQTLNSRMGIADLAWLDRPGLVVIDECHHAIAPSYTGLLGWLNAAYRPPGAEAVDEPPILGLSATPFRMDDEESARLAKRFDQLWFPDNQAELHARLLAQGVLAQVENEELHSEAALTSNELDVLSRFKSLEGIEADRFLEAFNQRLAGDVDRNRRIVARLGETSERSILLFANSVSHAAELSARLNLIGIAAAAISGETPRSARRWFLDRFQQGEIRVICNHSVLTTGFDAPKTDLILISRQVFSPVRYMQMVGRGLRGPKNGGTPTCRIVTVLDNLGRFQNRHPYHFCRRYFETLVEQPTSLEMTA